MRKNRERGRERGGVGGGVVRRPRRPKAFVKKLPQTYLHPDTETHTHIYTHCNLELQLPAPGQTRISHPSRTPRLMSLLARIRQG